MVSAQENFLSFQFWVALCFKGHNNLLPAQNIKQWKSYQKIFPVYVPTLITSSMRKLANEIRVSTLVASGLKSKYKYINAKERYMIFHKFSQILYTSLILGQKPMRLEKFIESPFEVF